MWEQIESATRYLAKKSGDIYVITGPIFSGDHLTRINSRVLVPTKIFKAIYVPSLDQGAAYVTNNAPGESYEVLSIAELQKLTGIDFFPKMTQMQKEHAMTLPTPQPRHSNYKKHYEPSNNSFFDKIDRKVHNFNKGY